VVLYNKIICLKNFLSQIEQIFNDKEKDKSAESAKSEGDKNRSSL
jgi:hypothetical protein